jgi:hypothetical protein
VSAVLNTPSRERRDAPAPMLRTLRFPGCAEEALSVAVSVGGSLCQQGADWAVWYSDADCALYEAKGIGGDGYRVIEGAGAPVAPA